MKHFAEEELIAYHLHESSDEAAISRHLENCSECADLSWSLSRRHSRVFSAESVPQLDLERNWHQLRGNLSVLTPERRRFEFFRWHWAWPAIGLATAALVLLGVFSVRFHHSSETVPRNIAVNGHGPLTTEPTGMSVANHLDAAERLLTEVNNSPGPLDDATREQAHNLLLQNAIYVSAMRETVAIWPKRRCWRTLVGS